MSERTLCCSVRSAPSQKKRRKYRCFLFHFAVAAEVGEKDTHIFPHFSDPFQRTPMSDAPRYSWRHCGLTSRGGESLAQFSPLSRVLPRDRFLRFVAASPLLLFLSWVGGGGRSGRETDRTLGRREEYIRSGVAVPKAEGEGERKLFTPFPLPRLSTLHSIPPFRFSLSLSSSPSCFLIASITNPILFLLLPPPPLTAKAEEEDYRRTLKASQSVSLPLLLSSSSFAVVLRPTNKSTTKPLQHIVYFDYTLGGGGGGLSCLVF